MLCSAKFAIFVKRTSLIAYNDAFADYLDQLIYAEENKSVVDAVLVAKLKEDKEKYMKEIENIKNAVKGSDPSDVETKEVYQMKDKLMNLEHFGATFHDILGKLILRCRTIFQFPKVSPESNKNY